MITVLAYFYHPDLGTVRGTVIDGVPMSHDSVLTNWTISSAKITIPKMSLSPYLSMSTALPKRKNCFLSARKRWAE